MVLLPSMLFIDTTEFEKLVTEAIDNIPEKYAKRLQNVAFVVEDWPTAEQRVKLNLHPGQSLFGLYEGVPLTQRAYGYNLVLPDKITIFKGPIEQVSDSIEQADALVRNTIWHEVAHYFGLNHERIRELEDKPPRRKKSSKD